MKTNQNVGLIECGNSTMSSLSNDFDPVAGLKLTKILATQSSTRQLAREMYPEAEIVHTTASIFDDQSIQLVIVAGAEKQDLGLVAQAVGAGKQVRIL
jgi:hypothetical protein